jgi:hypothetical protein
MIQPLKFDEILDSLDKLDPWLISLGIQPKTDRWHQAAKTLRAAKEQRERVERGEAPSTIKNYIHGLFEAMEAHEIFRAFSGDSSEPLREKVQRALCGPIAPPDEQPKNSAGRNTMFELSLAANWKNLGLPVGLGEPDILLRLAGTPFLVECKRPFHENSVRSNIEDAARQLGKELDRPENGRARGIVAISLSRVFTQNDLVCYAGEDEGRQFIRKALEAMIASHRREWRVRQFLQFHPRIVAVMFRLAVPWDVNGERLVYATMVNYVQAGADVPGWQLLEKELSALCG